MEQAVNTKTPAGFGSPLCAGGIGPPAAANTAYNIMPDSVMFLVQEVQVDLSPFDLPGPSRRKITCMKCGQVVRDNREVRQNCLVYCRPCASGAYFTGAPEIVWPETNWSPYAIPDPTKLTDSGLPRPAILAGRDCWEKR
jgi:hypothetical protein